MNRWAIARKTLRDTRGTLIGIAASIGAIAFVDVLAYPSYRTSLESFDMPEVFKGFMGEAGNMTSPEGFLTVEFFSWAPILLIVLAIVSGSFAVAGEEAQGTLDLVLAQPISRRRFIIEKSVALVIDVVLAAFASVAGYLLGELFVNVGLPIWRFVAATFNMLPLTFIFLGMAIFASAAAPSRSSATIPVIGLVVVTYFVHLLGASVPAIEHLRVISPFYWADPSRVLIHGLDWWRSTAMTATSLVFFGGALLAFEHRDIAQMGRELHWRRPHVPSLHISRRKLPAQHP